MKKDTIYFTVVRNGDKEDVCFCDLTAEEIEKVTHNMNENFWKRTALHLRDRLNEICKEDK